ncbi:MAG TPA: Gfo/Idh/MocA family oxidoreductase [Jatrophihabitans sp.]|jgi:predicted dehydrogenase
MGDDLRVGLVGAGRLAEVGYLPALHAASGVRLVGLAEIDPNRRERVAALAGVPAFRDAAALLAAVPLDGLVLATPASAHLADAGTAAAAGVAVLVEKPPAINRHQAAELAALTPTPWIGFNRRFDPGIEALRAATPAGEEIGVFLEFDYRRHGWGAHAVTDDALLDVGPHLIDLARWLTRAEVTNVRSAVLSPQRAEFDLVLGAARARIRCATNRPHRERVEVRHRRGAVFGRHHHGGLLNAVRGRLAPRSGPHPLVTSLTTQLEAFARAVRGAPEPTLGRASDGLAVMATIDTVRACAAGGGRPVTIKTVTITPED